MVFQIDPVSNTCFQNRYIPIQTLRQCLEAIPFDCSHHIEILSQIEKLLPSYVFLEHAKTAHSFGASETPAVPLLQRFQQIQATQFTSDGQFHQAMFDLFVPLQDAHTAYLKPAMYTQFYMFLPIRLDAGHDYVQFSIDSTEWEAYSALYPSPNLSEIQQWRLVLINGRNATQVISEFANSQVGLVKDAGSRWNIALHGFGNGKGFFYFRSFSSFYLPELDSMTFTVQKENQELQIELYWMGLNGNAPYQQARATSNRMPHQPTHRRNKTEHFLKHYKQHLHQHRLLLETEPVSFIKWSKNVGILRISSFENSNPFDPNWIGTFSQRIEEALVQFNGTQHLLIDLRGNGGGDICLGYAVLRYLFPQLAPQGPKEGIGPHEWAKYNIKHSKLFSLLAQKGAEIAELHPVQAGTEWSPNAWYHAGKRTQFRNSNWYRSGIDDMSEDIYFGCAAYYDYFEAPGTSFKGLPSDQIWLLSDGLCGSTCAVFSSFIQQHQLGQTIVLGGYSTSSQQFWSFPGGEVYRLSEVVQDAAFLTLLPNEIVPGPLDDGVDLSFAMVAIQPWLEPNVSTPLEYKFVPATHHLACTCDPQNHTCVYFNVISTLLVLD